MYHCQVNTLIINFFIYLNADLFDRPLGNLPHLTPRRHLGFSDSCNKGGIPSVTLFYHVTIFNTYPTHPMRRIFFLVSLWQWKRKKTHNYFIIFFLHNRFKLSATEGSLAAVQQIIHPNGKNSCQWSPTYLDETSEIKRTTKLHAVWSLTHYVFFKAAFIWGKT